MSDYTDRLSANREEKDEFLSDHPQSPIPPEHREEFDGLRYFAPDESYRVAAVVSVHDDPEPVEMETTAAAPVRYLRVATFELEVNGEQQSLHAYRQESDESKSLFIPFRDKTTGHESYQHGRYMELEPEEDLSDGDTATVDFNLAYSPFCAFSETFSCPLPPEENWLDVAVRAGEKAPQL